MTQKTTSKLLLSIFVLTLVSLGVLITMGNVNVDKLPIEKTERQLRVISMNVSADNVLPTSLQDNLIKTQPDIIVVIEWTGNNLDLNKFSKAGYQTILNHPRKKVHGICVLSKLKGISTIIEAPIKTHCTLPLGQFRFKWQDKYFSLFAIHAPPPVPSCKGTTSKYLEAIADWVDNGKLNSNIGIGKKDDIVLMAGDFNSLSFQNGIESLLKNGLKDKHSKYNFINPTWKPIKPFPYLARIDYILYSNELKLSITRRFHIDNSDHLGIMADLNF